MIRFVADTHTVIWYIYGDARLSPAAQSVFAQTAADGDQVAVSAITLVEIVYLIEKRRIATATLTRLVNALNRPNSILVEAYIGQEVAKTMQRVPRADVPDMPDRIIAATALHLGVPLISRDRKIQLSTVQTIW